MAEGRHHPYKDQPARAFWRRSVEGVHPLEIGGWYRKKFSLEGRRLATGGSCFAQHIGREMKRRGADYIDVEPAPGFLPPALHLDHGYGIYSARYGNLYTARQLLQLLQRAAGEIDPVDRAWTRGDGFVDPFRPNIEPGPVGTAEGGRGAAPPPPRPRGRAVRADRRLRVHARHDRNLDVEGGRHGLPRGARHGRGAPGTRPATRSSICPSPTSWPTWRP